MSYNDVMNLKSGKSLISKINDQEKRVSRKCVTSIILHIVKIQYIVFDQSFSQVDHFWSLFDPFKVTWSLFSNLVTCHFFFTINLAQKYELTFDKIEK
jgi:hypothetical protein